MQVCRVCPSPKPFVVFVFFVVKNPLTSATPTQTCNQPSSDNSPRLFPPKPFVVFVFFVVKNPFVPSRPSW